MSICKYLCCCCGLLFSSPRDLPDPGNWTHICCISCTGRQFLHHWATGEAHVSVYTCILHLCVCFCTHVIVYRHSIFKCIAQVALMVKNLPANAGDVRDASSIPGSRKIPWRRKWQPTPVCLPGESHGQRSLVGYSPWGGKESDMTEHASTSLKAISPNVVTLGIRASTHEFGRGHSSVHSRR